MSVVTTLATGWEFVETARAALPQLTEAGKPDWLPAQVPGYVHLDLVANGVVPHPFYRMNEAGCQWIDETEWTYRTTFLWEPKPDCPVRKIDFAGLDTVCDIYLNGQIIASHDNAFLPLTIDVSNLLVEGKNTLQIYFQSAVKVGMQRLNTYFDKEGLPYPRANFYDRSFVRKPQYMYGWDWGPRLVSCGITGPVSLVEKSHEPEILDTHSVQTHHEDGTVTVRLTIELDKPLGDYLLEASLSDDESYQEFQIQPEGETIYTAEVTVEAPRLWDTEDPHLYDIHVELYDQEDRLYDTQEFSIGLRTVELVQEPDEHGQSFYFRLNGDPVYAFGANWIPDHSFPATVTREQYRDRLESAKEMGMNMIRVWGGGQYESEDFYDLCDELGILVWQDFPYGCAYYPDDAEHQAVAKAEASYHIKRLRNRPSLAIWCGNNENHTMFDSKWGGADNNPPRYYGEHLYHQALQQACDELDPSRPYIPSSPIGKDEKLASPEGVDAYNHNMGHIGDSHYWDVWHGRGDWKHYDDSTTRFSSEFGFASAPSMEVLEEFISDRAFQPFSAELNWHNKTRKPIDVFMGLVNLHYPTVHTVEDLVYYTQLNQRDAMRYGIEHFRRADFCKGTLIWQLNDCWPVQSWAILDNFGNWKAVAYELQRLYSPTLHSLVKTEATVQLHVCHHNALYDHAPSILLQAVDLTTGEIFREVESNDVTVPVGSSTLATELDIQGLTPVTTAVFAVDQEDGEEVAWTLLSEPKDLQIPLANITVAAVDDNQIMLRTDAPVVDLWLRDPDDGVQFGLNFITSPTPATWLIQTNGPVDRVLARSLAGHHPVTYTNSPL